MQERRKEPRIPLDCPLFASLRIAELTLPCLLRDVSRNGAMVCLAPKIKADGACAGARVVFVDLPETLTAVLSNCSGEILWRKGEMFGIRFDAELSVMQENLTRYLESA